jgi:uncharacterized protein with NAD-binding domain and iron-sulfur cluster
VAKRVIILGGGVAGMTAAHELISRDFDVEVLERRSIPGGKARSMCAPGTGTGGRRDLPAEHGFRFFPGFYKNLPDTMARIDCRDQGCEQGHKVVDHLVPATEMQIARARGRPVGFDFSPLPVPGGGIMTVLHFLARYAVKLRISVPMAVDFGTRLAKLVSREDEWLGEYERTSWRKFCGADTTYKGNLTYKKYLAGGITRTMVAAGAHEISARTAGLTAIKLLLSLSGDAANGDRVLDGPTNDVWIDPWRAYLEDRNVRYRTLHDVTRIHCEDGRITGVTVKTPEGTKEIGGRNDYYVCALPAEVMRDPQGPVSAEMRQASPVFSQLKGLELRWMNGIQFYLREDVEQVCGHTIYVDSPWALTSISQQQFWKHHRLADRGNGDVRGVLSVDISDWLEGKSNKRAAKWSGSPVEIKEQVLKQMGKHLRKDAEQMLYDANIVGFYLDESIEFPNPEKAAINLEPLLVNAPCTWDLRPGPAVDEIENLFLASDYVQTNTDLATMEAANEAARHAVDEILKKEQRADFSALPAWKPPAGLSLASKLGSILGGLVPRDYVLAEGVEPGLPGGLEEATDPAAVLADRIVRGTPEAIRIQDPHAVLAADELQALSTELIASPERAHRTFDNRLDDLRSGAEVIEIGGE